jgi:hypothetical protein
VRDELAALLALVCFRALPFVGYVAASRRHSIPNKLLILAAFFGAAGWVMHARPSLGTTLVALPLLYAYLALLALVLPGVARATQSGWIAHFSLAVLLGGIYLVLPPILAPKALTLPILILGWESMLKAFSYCVDDGADGVPLRRREVLFFLLVSPTLVLSERGHWLEPSRFDWRGGARLALGVATLGLEGLLRLAAAHSPIATGQLAITLSLGLAFYFSHSGLASVQIGLMGLIGYRVPERYRYPFLAKSPSDFWSRWNIWLGSWAKRYLFTPTYARLHRRLGGASVVLLHGIAVIVCFVAIGMLHDLMRWTELLSSVDGRPISLAATGMFAVFGAVIVLWNTVVRPLRKLVRRATSRSLDVVLSWGPRLAFFPCLLLMFWLAQSALAGGGLPAPLPDLLFR